MAGTIIDVFNSNAFNSLELTSAINNVPNKYGICQELGLFRGEGVTTRSVSVEFNTRTLKLLTSKAVGAPGDLNKSGLRTLKSFNVPHYPFEDVLLAEDIQNKRQFGSANQLEDAMWVLNKKLMEMKDSHDQTLEWMRLGCLKGSITDGAGTVLLAPYTDFGINQTSVGFALTTAGTNVLGKCLEVKRAIEVALLGSQMSYVQCLCDSKFYDALTSHANVKAAFANWNAQQNNYTDYRRTGFYFGGIIFREYYGSVPDSAGNSTKLLADDTALFFPMGTTDVFVEYYAPADFMETVNTVGLPVYAKQEPMDFNRGLKIHTQSNPLPLCLKPAVVVAGTTV